MFNSVLKRAMPIIFWAAGLFIVGVVSLVLGTLPGQWRRDRDYEAKLQPSIEFVQSVQRTKHRLPTDAEFASRPSAQTDWMVDLVTADSSDAAFVTHGGKTKSDFAVRIWRGETWTYYFSGSKKFDIVEP